ncbi:hypothetical protein F4806DRAFT_22228 [Annulohypoxylon nitens]|nr:hypothetical protein F4806DRAFT_22228 [Annulohypoxylon nitens]
MFDGQSKCATAKTRRTTLSPADDDEIWAKYENIEGLKGVDGQPLKLSGSYYSYGPYPRNRRILADIALAAGWTVEKARVLERRYVNRIAKHLNSFPDASVDLSDPNQPKMKNGRPFTFQNVSWSFLRTYIELEMKEMDPTKLATVKAAVLDLYETNSKTGRKKLPVYPRGTKRISDDALPVSSADIERAHEELDKNERFNKAMRVDPFGRRAFASSEKVKLRIKVFLLSGKMSEEEFRKAIDVTKSEFEMFMKEKKKRPQLESKVFHNAPSFIREQMGEKPARKRKRDATDLDVARLR